ncbi:dipeptide epimerase [Cyanobacteria bacterium FACHB-472]|nr:dipeptide epimerase [Cyanobacteria bacterium FACHB-472]
MRISIETFTVNKRFPLTISRGTTAQTTNVWVRVIEDGIEGWGEGTPFSIGEQRQTTESILEQLQQIAPSLEQFHTWERQQIESVLQEALLPSSAQAAIDVALHDWMGKRLGLPLWRLWGLDCSRIVPTSVTIGINSPTAAVERSRDWRQLTGAKVLKVKLGSSLGIEADQAMLMAIREDAPEAILSVDANGGWNLEDAVTMCAWLSRLGVKYVEQPLPRGENLGVMGESPLRELKARSLLPIFVDESCFTSRDIPLLADKVHGVNIKLMKCGGLTEAIRMVHTAKACGLQVMFGCYSDSVISNTAAAQLSPLADYLDLDSHLNLIDDPFTGASLQDGRLLPNDLPGLGISKN